MTLSPKHLNFDEMWKLYKILKPFLGKDNVTLLDEAISILPKMTENDFKNSLLLLFGTPIYETVHPSRLGIEFIKGIKYNKFFYFVDFIGQIHNGD